MNHCGISIFLSIVKPTEHFSGNWMNTLYLYKLELLILTLYSQIKTCSSRLTTSGFSFPISYGYAVEIRIQ